MAKSNLSDLISWAEAAVEANERGNVADLRKALSRAWCIAEAALNALDEEEVRG